MKVQIGDYEVSVKAKFRDCNTEHTLDFLSELALCYYSAMELYEKRGCNAVSDYYRKAANNLHAICEKAGLYK